MDGLRIGEYTLSEVSDNVSAGYILPADKKITVQADSTVEIILMIATLSGTP